MPKFWISLLLAAVILPAELHGQDGPSVESFGCVSPAAFYEALNHAESLGAKERVKPVARGCRLLAGAFYLPVGEEDGLAKIRVFATPGDWATSSVVYTLDEMLTADDMLDPSAVSRQ